MLPGAQFQIHDIVLNGSPWRTRVAILTQVSGNLPRGERYENTVMQFLTLSWGKVTSVETIEDLQRLAKALRAVADAGNVEALAAPITDS